MDNSNIVEVIIPDVSDVVRTRRLIHDPDCGKQVEMETVNGIPHGKYIEYWPNGMVRTQGLLQNGRQAGQWAQWDENGRLIVGPEVELQMEKKLEAAAQFNKQHFPDVYTSCGGC